MQQQPNNPSFIELTLIALGLALMLIISPLTDWWASINAPWYSPYLIWAVAIIISWLLQRHLNKDEL